MKVTQSPLQDSVLPLKTREGRPIGMLLAALYVFASQGKEEVSLSEFQESISEFQRKSTLLAYSFSERFLLSPDLLQDLKELEYHGYIRDYRYRLDSLLPKRFLSLTALGRGAGKKVLETFKSDAVEDLTNAIKSAMVNYSARWRLWAR